jgi:hypothetical protein
MWFKKGSKIPTNCIILFLTDADNSLRHESGMKTPDRLSSLETFMTPAETAKKLGGNQRPEVTPFFFFKYFGKATVQLRTVSSCLSGCHFNLYNLYTFFFFFHN